MLCAVVVLGVLARRINIPYPVACVAGGLAMSFIHNAPHPVLEPDLFFSVRAAAAALRRRVEHGLARVQAQPASDSAAVRSGWSSSRRSPSRRSSTRPCPDLPGRSRLRSERSCRRPTRSPPKRFSNGCRYRAASSRSSAANAWSTTRPRSYSTDLRVAAIATAHVRSRRGRARVLRRRDRRHRRRPCDRVLGGVRHSLHRARRLRSADADQRRLAHRRRSRRICSPKSVHVSGVLSAVTAGMLLSRRIEFRRRFRDAHRWPRDVADAALRSQRVRLFADRPTAAADHRSVSSMTSENICSTD